MRDGCPDLVGFGAFAFVRVLEHDLVYQVQGNRKFGSEPFHFNVANGIGGGVRIVGNDCLSVHQESGLDKVDFVLGEVQHEAPFRQFSLRSQGKVFRKGFVKIHQSEHRSRSLIGVCIGKNEADNVFFDDQVKGNLPLAGLHGVAGQFFPDPVNGICVRGRIASGIKEEIDGFDEVLIEGLFSVLVLGIGFGQEGIVAPDRQLDTRPFQGGYGFGHASRNQACEAQKQDDMQVLSHYCSQSFFKMNR